MSYIEQLGKNAQKASKTLISLGSVEKNNFGASGRKDFG